jgi:hypothetical protein
MATGYVVSGRGDLDSLFKARVSTAIANTGFTSNGGVDLAQRFEPRAATTAITATNFKAGASDLASLFMDISASGGSTSLSMTAGVDATFPRTGYDRVAGGSNIGTVSSNVYDATTILAMRYRTSVGFFDLTLSKVTPAVADSDTIFQRIELTGVFSDSSGVSVTRTLLRSAAANTSTAVTGGNTARNWAFDTGAVPMFINGNTYTISIFHT